MRFLLAIIVYYFYRAISATWQVTVIESPGMISALKNNTPLILAHWHGDEVAVLHLVKRYRLATMTSTSKDGSIIDYVIKKLGGDTSRGSSTRGGVSALKGLVRLGRSGRVMSVAVDGPRGPIYQPKPGVFELSRLCNAPIAAVGVTCHSKKIFERSWNKAYLPHPFAKVVIVFSEPIRALTGDDDPKDLRWPHQLIKQINVSQQDAAKLIDAHNA